MSQVEIISKANGITDISASWPYNIWKAKKQTGFSNRYKIWTILVEKLRLRLGPDFKTLSSENKSNLVNFFVLFYKQIQIKRI